MDESRAREILGFKDGQEFSWGDIHDYVRPNNYDDIVCIDGDFNADELEAIAWWMRNKERK
jgi:hypothetical protein